VRAIRVVSRTHARPRKPAPGEQDPAVVPPAGGQPAWQRGRITEIVQLAHQLKPDGLADVLGVGAAQLVTAYRPDQPGP